MGTPADDVQDRAGSRGCRHPQCTCGQVRTWGYRECRASQGLEALTGCGRGRTFFLWPYRRNTSQPSATSSRCSHEHARCTIRMYLARSIASVVVTLVDTDPTEDPRTSHEAGVEVQDRES